MITPFEQIKNINMVEIPSITLVEHPDDKDPIFISITEESEKIIPEEHIGTSNNKILDFIFESVLKDYFEHCKNTHRTKYYDGVSIFTFVDGFRKISTNKKIYCKYNYVSKNSMMWNIIEENPPQNFTENVLKLDSNNMLIIISFCNLDEIVREARLIPL